MLNKDFICGFYLVLGGELTIIIIIILIIIIIIIIILKK